MTISRIFWFTLHLGLLIISYAVPFLFDWQLVVTAYALVMLQFIVFDKCLMNEGHGLDEENDQTFYSSLIEAMGYPCDRKIVKRFVRGYLYILLILYTLWWQLLMNNEPLVSLLPF